MPPLEQEQEKHLDVQEALEQGVYVEDLKARRSFLVDEDGRRWRYRDSYANPVGVEVLVLVRF